jgi:hypothetical protein
MLRNHLTDRPTSDAVSHRAGELRRAQTSLARARFELHAAREVAIHEP